MDDATAPFVANTDRAWFDSLSTRAVDGRVDEVNFWLPKAKQPMKQMAPGEPIFFRLKRPEYRVAGYGFFAHFHVVTVDQAWDLFGWRNGDDARISFLRRLSGYRGEDLSVAANRKKPLGCTVLRDAHFWPAHRWLPWGEAQGWRPNIVQGATERDPARAALLLAQIRLDAASRPSDLAAEFQPISIDDRARVDATIVRREAQGTFRIRLLSAYEGRCAISGERTQPVLAAAHIQPYLGPASNHIQNGLIMTQEFHTLFDKGYVTVTPDYEVRVSEALRDEWQNGVRYYAHDKKRLRVIPEVPHHRPSRDALAWHREHVYLG